VDIRAPPAWTLQAGHFRKDPDGNILSISEHPELTTSLGARETGVDRLKAKTVLGSGIIPMRCAGPAIDPSSMSAMASAAPRRREMLELMMVTIYLVLTAYLFVCNSPPQIGFALRQAVSPFQIKARARNAGAQGSASALRLSQFESRERRLSGRGPGFGLCL